MNLPKILTRNLLFTGKGGVGKTSIACAIAVSLAERGKRVLLVSTDPASNLDEVLETRLGIRPTPIAKMTGLHAMNVDPEEPHAFTVNALLDPIASFFLSQPWTTSKNSYPVHALSKSLRSMNLQSCSEINPPRQCTITSSSILLPPAIRFGFYSFLQHGLISSRQT